MSSVYQAIQHVFGDGVTIQGCFYHLTQSTWRNIQQLGLSDLYKRDDGFRLFCGQLDGLALLPVDEVTAGMAHLRATAPPEAASLLEYFDTTYVSGTYRQRKSAAASTSTTLSLRRVVAPFPPSVWNCNKTKHEGGPRTNNVAEGWNNAISHLVDQSHPSIWKLILNLKKEYKRVQLLVLQDQRGIRPPQRNRRETSELQKRLHNLCGD